MFVLTRTGRIGLVRCTALLLVLTTGCVSVAPLPEAPQSQVVATPLMREPTSPAGTTLMLDLNVLAARLRATNAIGPFTKISVKNQVDDLMKQFREHYEGKTARTMTELRRSYDLLIMKLLSLLQDADQLLASAIVSSREAIWGLLSDQNTFANL
jgi:hypothetical protein